MKQEKKERRLNRISRLIDRAERIQGLATARCNRHRYHRLKSGHSRQPVAMIQLVTRYLSRAYTRLLWTPSDPNIIIL